jgi:hypothetical protein
MKTAAAGETSTSYVLGFHDCTHVVTAALDAGGLKNGESNGSIGITNNATGKDYEDNNWFPASKQATIENKNSGVGVDSQLVPVPSEYS